MSCKADRVNFKLLAKQVSGQNVMEGTKPIAAPTLLPNPLLHLGIENFVPCRMLKRPPCCSLPT